MKITVNVPMSDFISIKGIIPVLISGEYNKFLETAKGFSKSKERHNMTCSSSFNVVNGFTFVFEGDAQAVINAIENEIRMDLRILLEGVVSAGHMMIGTAKSAERVWQERQPKQEEAE